MTEREMIGLGRRLQQMADLLRKALREPGNHRGNVMHCADAVAAMLDKEARGLTRPPDGGGR